MPIVSSNGKAEWVGAGDPPKGGCCGKQAAPPGRTMGVCDVCRINDGDESVKPVRHCGGCDKWICDPCWNDWPRRGKAMTINLARKVIP